jgi:cephalosporin hydroxylase
MTKNKGILLTKKFIFQILLRFSLFTKTNIHLKILKKKLTLILKNAKTIEDIYDSIMKFEFLGVDIRPIQVRSEILQLLHIVHDLAPDIILEIGTNKGGTLALFCNVAPNSAKIISLDLPYGPFGGGYRPWKIPFYQSFTHGDQSLILLQKNSHEQTSVDEITTLLSGKKIDFLFIDGDHTYEGVKKDFEMYSPLVRPGGVIAFHDVVVHPPESGVNIEPFMKELEKKYIINYLIENQNQGSCGIAYLRK